MRENVGMPVFRFPRGIYLKLFGLKRFNNFRNSGLHWAGNVKHWVSKKGQPIMVYVVKVLVKGGVYFA